MTREQAKDMIEISKGEVYPYYIEDNVDEVIDKIYDLLEQRIAELSIPRTCSTCQFYDIESDYCKTYTSIILGVYTQWGCCDYTSKETK